MLVRLVAFTGPAALPILPALALLCALVMLPGCSRQQREEVEHADVEPLYELAQYEMAESAISGRLRNLLRREEIELRGFWLGLLPVVDGAPELSADIDANIGLRQAEEVSRLVAEVSLETLSKHDSVQVRVFWRSGIRGQDFGELGGIWTWGKNDELIAFTEPEQLQEDQQRRRWPW